MTVAVSVAAASVLDGHLPDRIAAVILASNALSGLAGPSGTSGIGLATAKRLVDEAENVAFNGSEYTVDGGFSEL